MHLVGRSLSTTPLLTLINSNQKVYSIHLSHSHSHSIHLTHSPIVTNPPFPPAGIIIKHSPNRISYKIVEIKSLVMCVQSMNYLSNHSSPANSSRCSTPCSTSLSDCCLFQCKYSRQIFGSDQHYYFHSGAKQLMSVSHIPAAPCTCVRV